MFITLLVDYYIGVSSAVADRQHACFKTKSWSNDLDDLGVPPGTGNLHMPTFFNPFSGIHCGMDGHNLSTMF